MTDNASAMSIPLAAFLYRALDEARMDSESRDVKFATPNLLMALLDVPDGSVHRTFNLTLTGGAYGYVTFSTYLQQVLTRWVQNQSQYGLSYEPFRWTDRADVRFAQSLAMEQGHHQVTDAHLLVGILESDSSTKWQLKVLIGDYFAPLLERAYCAAQVPYEGATPGSQVLEGGRE